MTRNPKNKKRNTKAVSSMFDSIPHELVSEVLSRVASSSIKDIFNAKLSCKMLNEIAKDMYVYQRVSLDEVPIIPWKPISQEQETFLNTCLQSENPESLYRQAVLDYFNKTNLESTCMHLQKAVKNGHTGALYVTCIVLLFSGNEELKQQGINILKMIWVKNPVLLEPPVCCTTRDHHHRKSRWSEVEEDVTCEACVADQEINLLSGRYNFV
ncbi:hypothetical protein MIMGU_mgv1a013775mg [Erythranthe guttata]|uniref:F-box domain-containing protein n=1 Tax=Erythranthe guttata TaxID=4155 RepID=A0A022QIE4_ERYGU|nr:hypothetical protein MIMGU_mgv1a013775mg [Erythranthe guttata]